MSTASQLAHDYFNYSNESNLAKIAMLLNASSSYYSSSSGFYLGVDAIMTMQQAFHQQFNALEWTVDSLVEIKSNIIIIDFEFQGELKTGELLQRKGRETILVYNQILQHIAVEHRE